MVGFCVQGLTDWRLTVTEDQTELPSLLQEGAQLPQTTSVPHLQRKLKDAARKILSLSQEREQLLEMGNRLRAELGRPEGKYLGEGGGPGHSWRYANGEGRWCHGSATGGQERSFLACLPQAWGQKEGCRLASQRPLVVEWSQPDALGTIRASSQHWVSLDPLLHLEETALEQLRSCEASKKVVPGQPPVGVPRQRSHVCRDSVVFLQKRVVLESQDFLFCLF